MNASVSPSSLRQRRRTVLVYGLSAAVTGLAFLLGLGQSGKQSVVLWAVALTAVLVNLWSGGRLRSPEWGFYDWKRQPDALDERQRERALWAVAQTHRIVTVALVVLYGILIFSSDAVGMVKRLTYILMMMVGLMGMLPTAILAWTEPDLPE